MAHAEDLRSEGMAADQVEKVVKDFRDAGLDPADRALCVYAEKLTRAPGEMAPADVEALRSQGFRDEAIHDAAQVISYFNYINRIADGLGVDLEPEMKNLR